MAVSLMRHFLAAAILTAVCSLLSVACVPLVAQTAEPFNVGQSVSFHSKVLNEDRQILVYLPDGYEHSSAAYPVIYVMDAETHWLHVGSTTRLLSLLGAMPQVIVVGVTNSDRARDMTPHPATPDKDFPGGGGSAAFVVFLTDEVRPYVDKQYRSSPFAILAGTSLSGLFVIDAFLNHPGSFNAYLAASPSLWWDKNAAVHRAQVALQTKLTRNTFLYISLCEGDSKELQESTHEFETEIKKRPPDSLHTQYLNIAGETHNSSPLKSFYAGLQWLYADWASEAPDSLVALKRHYKQLSEQYGYQIAVPEREVNALGYSLLFSDKKLQAIPVFRSNVDAYPESANAWDSLGDAYKTNGQLDLARQSYENGCAISTKSKDLNASSMCANLADVKKLIEHKGGFVK